MRTTRQRVAVSAVLDELEGFRSAQEIHELMRRRGETVGLSTVYRTLQGMVEAGELDALRQDSGEVVYRRCRSGHHHHLVCRRCGRTEEIEAPAVERWARGVGEDFGYVDVSHTVEVFGTCPACAARTQEAPT